MCFIQAGRNSSIVIVRMVRYSSYTEHDFLSLEPPQAGDFTIPQELGQKILAFIAYEMSATLPLGLACGLK